MVDTVALQLENVHLIWLRRPIFCFIYHLPRLTIAMDDFYGFDYMHASPVLIDIYIVVTCSPE